MAEGMPVTACLLEMALILWLRNGMPWKVRQEEREIGGGNEEIRGVEKLLEELVEMGTESEKIEE